MTNIASSLQRPRLPMLDALRGICSISLMFYHLFAWNGTTVFQIGTFGVYLFYVLSGFSMWYVYAVRPLSLELIRSFFIARFARIFPLYFLTCVLGVLARAYAGGIGSLNSDVWYRFLLNITFTFGLTDPGRTSILPGGWSIGIEWVFYLAFPLLLLFVRKIKVMIALLLVGLIVNMLTAHILFADGTLESQWMPYTQFPTFFVYFIAGIAAAELFSKMGNSVSSPARNTLCRIVPWVCLAIIFAYPSDSAEAYLRGWHVPILILLSMLTLICAASLQNLTKAEIVVYRFLGDISYSTYLLFFFVYSAQQILLKHLYPNCPFTLFAATCSVSTLVLSYLVYRFYEVPARRYINHHCKGKA